MPETTPRERQVIPPGTYEKIATFQALHDAWREARRGKRYRSDVLEFSDGLEDNLLQLERELRDGTYKVGPYRPFYVYEPKQRLVMALEYRDRIVQWAIYNALNPYYNRRYIEDSYACRKGKGSHAAADKLQYWMRQVERKGGTWYYLKLDISKYFYRVSHEVLVEILSETIKDERLLRLLEKIINCEDKAFGLPSGVAPEQCPEDEWLWDVGMPIGNLTSQMFANIYLDVLDQYAKHALKVRWYIRYMDDIIILSDSKEQLQAWKKEIEVFLRERLRLALNKKTAIRPISMGIDFVGYRIWTTHRLLKRQTARKIIRRFTGICRLLAAGEITQERFERITASWSGIMQHCDSMGLRSKLDVIYMQIVLGVEVEEEDGPDRDVGANVPGRRDHGRHHPGTGEDHRTMWARRRKSGRQHTGRPAKGGGTFAGYSVSGGGEVRW